MWSLVWSVFSLLRKMINESILTVCIQINALFFSSVVSWQFQPLRNNQASQDQT